MQMEGGQIHDKAAKTCWKSIKVNENEHHPLDRKMIVSYNFCMYIITIYDLGVVQKVLVLSVVFDDLWYAKMTFGES